MKYLTLPTLLAGLLLTASCGSPSKASADVVARVNGKDITTTQLEKQFQNRLNGAEQPPSPEEAQDLASVRRQGACWLGSVLATRSRPSGCVRPC